MLYNDFIQDILKSRPNVKNEKLFTQKHHILPRCKGGDDSTDNIIWLTPREHFIAHKILAEENPEDKQLVCAYWCMAHYNASRTECTPEEYEMARIAWQSSIKGYKHSEESKQKMRENHPDVAKEKHPLWGKHQTQKAKDKMSKSKKELWDSYENEEKQKRLQHLQDFWEEKTEDEKESIWAKQQETRNKRTLEEKEHWRKLLRDAWVNKTPEEQEKALQCLELGINRIKIICVETNIVYSSMSEAANKTNIDRASISKVCSGERKTAGGYHWKYYDGC